MDQANKNIEFNHIKASVLLDDFVHIYWEHKNLSKEANKLTIFPDGYFKLIFIFQNGKLVSYFMTGMWTTEFDFYSPPNSVLYGIKFKILAAEYIFHKEIASICNSVKDLEPDFLEIDKNDYLSFDDFTSQIETVLLNRLKQKEHKITANKLQLSQLLYHINGNIAVEEISNQINWSVRQINRYLNKYIGLSLKPYLNIQKCFSSYFHIRKGELYPDNEYFDQPHFIREIKKHTGNTPKELFKNKNDRFIQLRFIQRK